MWPVDEHFFLVHRGHELGLVPDHFLDAVDEDASAIERTLVNTGEYLDADVPPHPIGYDQASDRLHISLRERLSEKS